jgi:hypothetical protein
VTAKKDTPSATGIDKVAASAGYTVVRDGDHVFLEKNSTRWGPFANEDDLRAFLPKG